MTDLIQAAAELVGNDPAAIEDTVKNVSVMQQMKFDDSRGINPRQQLYDALSKTGDEMSQRRAQLLTQMAEDQPLSKSQTAAMMLIATLPVLVGGLVKGKKGIAKGAEAGGLGALTMAKGIQSDLDKKEKRAALEVASIDDKLAKIEDLKGKAKLDEINAMDTSREKGLDRQAQLTAAGIRAGGDRALAKALGQELNNISKALDVSKKGAEQQARTNSFEFDNKVNIPGDGMTDDDRKEVRRVSGEYKNLYENLKAMQEINTSLQAPMAQRMWGDKSTELGMRREAALKSLQRIEKVPGTMGNASLKELGAILRDPTSGWENLKSVLPWNTDIPDSMGIAEKVIKEDFNNFLWAKGVNQVPIGKPVTKNGKQYYVIGTDEQGNIALTPSLDKVNQKLQALGYDPIGGQ